MPRILYVIDPGNGDWKIASTTNRQVITYPAVSGIINTVNNSSLSLQGNRHENITMKKDGREFAIGSMAIKNCKVRQHDITEDKYTSPETELLMNASLSMLSNQTISLGNVVFLLPLHKMKQGADIVKAYQGKTFGGHVGYFGKYENAFAHNVQIEKIHPMAQPNGTLMNLILDDKGEIANKELAAKGIAIYDLGFKTNDGVVFRGLEPIGRLTIHSKNGMFVAYEEIQSTINANFNGLEVKLFEVPEIVRTGKVKGTSVTDIINSALYNLASNIIMEIKSKWHDAWEIEQVVFTGGGAQLLSPYLKQAFVDALYKDAQANAEGALKYATRLWGRELA